jgi:tRNA modification GTPase
MLASNNDTIIALSSGTLPAGVAVIRVSGTHCRAIANALGLGQLVPRKAKLADLLYPDTREVIDRGISIWFPGPNSFTGEDCLELQVHGGRAVVGKLLEILSGLKDTRLAEAGEFSRRAFENGKMDLTEIEGLSDLIAADTEWQRRQAQGQAGGRLRGLLEDWRSELIRCRAFFEVEFDFSDEDDVPDSMVEAVIKKVAALEHDISSYVEDGNRGEIIREGFAIVLSGAPNSGKSSLLNALADRDIAIVSSAAGTTRDVLQCRLDIDGIPVVLYDTAGIRDTVDDIELEGIKRALDHAARSDLTIWLSAADDPKSPVSDLSDAVVFQSKSDLAEVSGEFHINTVEKGGLNRLLDFIRSRLLEFNSDGDLALITRERHRSELVRCVAALRASQSLMTSNSELSSEELRIASDCLGRLTGFVDVEDLLDVIFSEFCIGK